MTEDRDGPARPFVAHHTAERKHLTQHPIGGAESAQLDVQRDRGQRPGQRRGEAGRAEDRELRVDAVVEFALHALRGGAEQLVGRLGARENLHGKRQLSPVADRAGRIESAADKSTRGVRDRVERVPTELEHPVFLYRSDIHVRNELWPAADPMRPGTRVNRSQQPPCGDHVDGVRGGEVHDAGAVGVQRQNHKAHQVVEVQDAHRLRRDLGAQQAGRGPAHHPVELAADRRRNPDDQARHPTGAHQCLGRTIHVGPARGLRHEQQPGTGAGCRIGHVRNPVDVGAAGYACLDRGQVDHRVGFVGELLQDGVAQRCANKLNVAVQAGVRALSNAADGVARSDQLPCNQSPECAGGVGNQDLHLGSPPPTSD